MQQYFVNVSLNSGDIISLNDDILHHLKIVLRKDSKYTFRIADCNGNIFYSNLINDKECLIGDNTNENNELDIDITCVISLIKNDKFELTIQKLVELGVKRIVPYEAFRSVVKATNSNKMIRLKKIIREAAEQSHRNIIPEICDPISIKDLNKYKSKINYICYESDKNISDIKPAESITYIIGPEGGFEDNEYKTICNMGFNSISLGKRILRAETAAIYLTSVIVSKCQ